MIVYVDLDHEHVKILLYEIQHTHLCSQYSNWHMQDQWLDRQSVPAQTTQLSVSMHIIKWLQCVTTDQSQPFTTFN